MSMRFHRYGRAFQLEIRRPEDLAHVLTLDESLWAATSAPAPAFRGDAALTAFLDSDGQGRIHTGEVRTAVRWLLSVLKDPSGVIDGSESLRLDVIDNSTAAGQALIQSAQYVLRTLGERDASGISLEQVRRFLRDLAQQPMNGDGVIVSEAAPDSETSQLITDIVDCLGGKQDLGGKPGADERQVEEFGKCVEDFLRWREKGQIPGGEVNSTVMPLGDKTSAAYEAYHAVAGKVDFYFALCRAMSFGPLEGLKAAKCLPDLEGKAFRDAEEVDACLAAAQLSKPGAGAALPLGGDGVNPYYRQAIANLRERTVAPILDHDADVLSEEEWRRIAGTLGPYGEYVNGKEGGCVEKIPLVKLQAYRGGTLLERVRNLIGVDKEVESIANGVRDVERLLIYHCHLFRFVNNFVNLSELYSTKDRALFERGSAVLDGRWFNLALAVNDQTAHQVLAKASNIFTMYLEVADEQRESTFCVAVPATAGTKGNLRVGKRGVFFDENGREYDARIIHIIDNPISLTEALIAPFVRLWGFIIGKIEALSGSSEKTLLQSTDKLIEQPPSQQHDRAPISAGPAGMLVGLSLSAAAIGSSFAFVTKTLSSLSLHQRMMGLAGAALLVGVPVSLIAAVKLRKQDLSSLLEGGGWAINSRMRMNRRLRHQFTKKSPYPRSARGTPRSFWRMRVLSATLAALVAFGVIVILRSMWQMRSQGETTPVGQTQVRP